jgi:hypothetical protein
MEIAEQQRTFAGFLRVTVWASGLLAAFLVFLTLAFAVGAGWFPALAVAFVVGIVIGLGLGMKGAWYATVVGLTVLGGVIGALAAVVSAFTG